MRLFTRLLVLAMHLLLCHHLSGQTTGYKVSGTVIDHSDSLIIGAEVNLLATDSVLLSGFTDAEGIYYFENVPNGSYRISVSFFGYVDQFVSFDIMDNDVALKPIQLNAAKEQIEGVTVIGEVTAVKQDGDTTSYNANAYKTNPDATAEDLIRKMPGIDLSSGTPQSQGENITKVLVDGKPFFGDDPSATLKNLPAEVIASIQVYDEQNEQAQFSGFDDGNTTKTLNIVTREDRREGMFGKFYGGYGNTENFDRDYYQAGGSLNMFKGNQRITIIGMSNNINNQNFSAEDIGDGSSSRGRGRRRGSVGRGGGDNGLMIDNRNGISTTHSLGLNYSNQWSDKLKVSGSYFFNKSNNSILEDIDRTYVNGSSEGQKYKESNATTTDEFNHRLNARVEYQIDPSNFILFAPSFKIQSINSLSNTTSSTFFTESNPLSTTLNTNSRENNNWDASYRLMYSHSFSKLGRTFSIFNNTSFRNTDGNNLLYGMNEFEDPDDGYNINQQANIDNSGWNTNVNLNYTEPLSKKWLSQVNAGIRYQYSYSDKRTYDYDPTSFDYTLLNTQLSNQFESRYTTPFAGLAVGYKDSIINFNVGANYQYASLENERVLPVVDTIKTGFQNILPNVSFTYNLGKGSSIRLRYRTSTNTPSVRDLQDVIDNTNTMILRSGNPDLDQNYEHRIFANYRTTNPVNNSNFFIMAMANIVNDYVANSTTIADTDMTVDGILLNRGMQYIKPVNLDGYYRLQVHSNYGVRVKPIKSNLNANINLSTSRTPGMVNNELNYAQNNSIGAGLSLSSNINENIDFNIGTQANYSYVNNTLNTSANNAFYNQNTRLDFNYILPFGLFFNTQLNHQYYQGIGDNFTQNFLLWNAAVGYKFLKKREAEIKLSVFDLLNQNQAISRTFTDIYTQDSWSNTMTQYFMLTFTYTFRNFKGQSSERDFGNQSEEGRQRGYRN